MIRAHILAMLEAFRALEREDGFAASALIDSAETEATHWFGVLWQHKDADAGEVADEIARLIEAERIELAAADAEQAVPQ